MQQQPRQDTLPEIAVRKELHRQGLRYRLHRAVVPGTRRRADIVFGPAKVAVFIDGCFWHGCTEHGDQEPAVNRWYWPAKINRNRQRDEDTTRRLEQAGWLVIRIWEHEVAAAAAERIVAAVRMRRGRSIEMR